VPGGAGVSCQPGYDAIARKKDDLAKRRLRRSS
jgi:hypothetical protein